MDIFIFSSYLNTIYFSLQAIDIKLLGSLNREDLKKICGENLPEWISFPVYEQVWLLSVIMILYFLLKWFYKRSCHIICNGSNEYDKFKFRNSIVSYFICYACFLCNPFYIFKEKMDCKSSVWPLLDGFFQVKWLNKQLSKLWPFVADVSKLACALYYMFV